MAVTEFYVPVKRETAALEALIRRAHDAMDRGNDAEFRAYLSGIVEILSAEQANPASARLSA
ncbi:MAG: hypothetical protein IPJ98_21300 [Bryobacterales bacterium]|nr:hypothetical protein [Bryobacterales bacterium]